MRGNLEIVVTCTAFVAALVFMLLPLDRSRLRAAWAKAAFVIVGVVGVLLTGTKLLVALSWVVPSRESSETIHQARALLCGLALGLILALVLSRQLAGSKRSV